MPRLVPQTSQSSKNWSASWHLALGLSAAVGFTAIAAATLCPIELRPHLGPPNGERFVAFLVLGALMDAARPGRSPSTAAVVILLACALEAAQLLVPGRDARIFDAVVKACGGCIGVFLAAALRRVARRP